MCFSNLMINIRNQYLLILFAWFLAYCIANEIIGLFVLFHGRQACIIQQVSQTFQPNCRKVFVWNEWTQRRPKFCQIRKNRLIPKSIVEYQLKACWLEYWEPLEKSKLWCTFKMINIVCAIAGMKHIVKAYRNNIFKIDVFFKKKD